MALGYLSRSCTASSRESCRSNDPLCLEMLVACNNSLRVSNDLWKRPGMLVKPWQDSLATLETNSLPY